MASIAAERSALSRVGGTLRRREQWGARNSYTSGRTVVEPADHQFVHITVSNPRSYASNDAHARAIEAIGRARFPATGISYNRGVMPDGTAYEFQPIGRRGAHTVNNKGISTCSTSGCPSRNTRIRDPRGNLNYSVRAYVICQNVNDPVSRAQVESMARVMAADILAGFVKRGAGIHGHRCVAWKSCPADPMWARMGELKRLRDKYVREGLTGDWLEMASEDDVRRIVREEVDRGHKRAGEWAAHLVWMHQFKSPENGKTYRAYQYLLSAYERIGWPNLRRGIEGIVRRETPALVEKVLQKPRGEYGRGSEVQVKLASPGAHRYAWGAMKENVKTQVMLSVLMAHLSEGDPELQAKVDAAMAEVAGDGAPMDED